MICQIDYDKHKETLERWWKGHGWPVLPKEALSDTGLISCKEDATPVAAGWLYLTNSRIAVLEHLVSDPETNNRNDYLNEVIENLCQIAQDLKYQHVVTFVNRPTLINRLENHGFMVGDTNMTILVRRM